MSNITICINAIIPIFIFIILGISLREFNLYDEGNATKLNAVMFRIFLPIMLFNNVYQADILSDLRPRYIYFAVISYLFVVACSFVLGNIFHIDHEDKSVVIQGLFRSNSVLMGIPLALSLAETNNAACVSVLIAIIIPIQNLFAVIVLEGYKNKTIKVAKLAKGIFTNPLIIGSIFGILFSAVKFNLPICIKNTISQLAAVGTPMMLILLGVSFHFSDLKTDIKCITLVTAFRLIIFPVVFLLIAYKFGFRGVEFTGLIGIFATPVAANSYTMTQQIGGNARLAGNIVVITNAISPVTVFAICLMFKFLGAF